MKTKQLLLFISALLLHCMMQAQNTQGRIVGKVVDEVTNEAVDYADVIVSDLSDHIVATAMVTDGKFNVEKVAPGEAVLMVRIMGYEPFVSEKLTIKAGQTINLGTIRLQEMATGLQEVTVSGQKSQIVYKLDRQRISSSASVTASGGTAVDILSNTPSVQVDADGNLSFRGSSNFQVYVDGKLSPLSGTMALQQIPSASIEDIELITTPSARYRAEGDVGIINITTKRAKESGWSGMTTHTGSTMGTWTSDRQYSYRKGKNMWYIGATLGNTRSKSEFQQQKMTIVDDYTTTSSADGTRHRNAKNYIAKAGWQYNDGKRHNWQWDFQVGQNSNQRGGDMTYHELRMLANETINDNTYQSHDRYELRKNLFEAAQNYTFKINDHSMLNITNRFRYDWSTLEYTESNMFDQAGKRYEGTRGYEREHHWDSDGSLSYTNKYSTTGNFETGYLYTTYSEHGNYNIDYWDRGAEQFEQQQDLYVPFYYRRQMHAVYAMINDKIGRFEFDAGLRAEHVIDDVTVSVPGGNIDKNRTDFFPSAHVAYSTPKSGTFSLGYSRRTNRPGIWQTEPYITYEDYYTRKIGSTDIRPEFIQSVELGYRKLFNNGNSLAATAFYRHRTDVVDWVREAYEPGVTLDRNVNAGKQDERGFELSGVIKATKWWSATLNGSIYRYDFTAQRSECSDADGTSYQMGWLNSLSLSADDKLQFDAHWIGPTNLTQGKENGYYYFDLGYRRQFKKNISLSAVAKDAFHTAKYYNRRANPTLRSETWVRPKYPNIIVSLSMSFNAAGKNTHATTSGGTLFEGKEF